MSSRDAATEAQAHPKLESSFPGTQVAQAAIVGQAEENIRLHVGSKRPTPPGLPQGHLPASKVS